jgi:hypothetical protein
MRPAPIRAVRLAADVARVQCSSSYTGDVDLASEIVHKTNSNAVTEAASEARPENSRPGGIGAQPLGCRNAGFASHTG